LVPKTKDKIKTNKTVYSKETSLMAIGSSPIGIIVTIAPTKRKIMVENRNHSIIFDREKDIDKQQ